MIFHHKSLNDQKKINRPSYSNIVLFVLIVFIFNSFGYLCLIIPAKLMIKKIVHYSLEKDKFNSDDLEVLAFKLIDLNEHKYDFEWEEAGKEFRFNGKMYDVEKMEVKGDSIYYKCYYDHKENILEEIFAIYFCNNKKDKTRNVSNHVMFFGLYSESIKNINPLQNNTAINIRLPKTEDRLMNQIKDVLTPPPRLIS